MLTHKDVLEERDATIAACIADLNTACSRGEPRKVTREPSPRQPEQTSEATAPGSTYRLIDVDQIPSPSPSLKMTEPCRAKYQYRYCRDACYCFPAHVSLGMRIFSNIYH